MPIEIPPLRRRRRDIPLLAEAFLQRLAREMGRRELRLSEEAKRALVEHSWPGNVRELQNCLERAAILCDGPVIGPAHLRLDPPVRGGPGLGDVLDLTGPLAEVVKRAAARAEEEAIALALREAGRRPRGGRRAARGQRLDAGPPAAPGASGAAGAERRRARARASS